MASDERARLERRGAELLRRQMEMPDSWPRWLALARLVGAAEAWRDDAGDFIAAGFPIDHPAFAIQRALMAAVDEWRGR